MRGSADAEQFDEFYRANLTKVAHLVYATTGDLTLAHDSAQEAFTRAWQRWSSVSRYDDPLAWVRTVARRAAVSTWRKRTNQDQAQRRLGPVPTGSVGSPNEDRVAVVAALQTLSEPVRVAVVLHYIADLSVEQIAEETDSPAGTVKARLHRGRAALAVALPKEESRRG